MLLCLISASKRNILSLVRNIFFEMLIILSIRQVNPTKRHLFNLPKAGTKSDEN